MLGQAVTSDQIEAFQLGSGVSITALKHFFAASMVAAAVSMVCLVLLGLIKQLKQGNVAAVSNILMQVMATGIVLGITLYIARG